MSVAALVVEGDPAAPALCHVAVHEKVAALNRSGSWVADAVIRQRRFRPPRRRPAGFRFPAGFPLAATRARAGRPRTP